MTAMLTAPVETIGRCDEDDDSSHIVCHCTDDRMAACGLDVADEPWNEGDYPDCPMCALAWPRDAASCPWGCACDEECGPA